MSRKTENAHAALCGWLNRADQNYMGGRLLARSGGFLVGGNLLWLAVEQLCKVVILQNRVEQMPLPERDPSQRSRDIDEMLILLEQEAKCIRPYHQAQPLVDQLAGQYPELDFASYQSVLAKLEQSFSERYYKGLPFSYGRDEIDTTDSLYFDLRQYVVLDIGMGKIDILCLLRTNRKFDLHSEVETDLCQ